MYVVNFSNIMLPRTEKQTLNGTVSSPMHTLSSCRIVCQWELLMLRMEPSGNLCFFDELKKCRLILCVCVYLCSVYLFAIPPLLFHFADSSNVSDDTLILRWLTGIVASLSTKNMFFVPSRLLHRLEHVWLFSPFFLSRLWSSCVLN